MDLILKISGAEIGLITDVDQHLFLETLMQGGCIFHGDRILGTDPTGQLTGEKSDAVFLDMNSLYPSAMSHFYLPCGNYNGLAILLLQISPIFTLLRKMDHKDGFSKLMVKFLWNFMNR